MKKKLKQKIIVTALCATPVSCEAEGTFGRHRETSSDDTRDASDGPPPSSSTTFTCGQH